MPDIRMNIFEFHEILEVEDVFFMNHSDFVVGINYLDDHICKVRCVNHEENHENVRICLN